MPLTVKELREALQGYPDDQVVYITVNEIIMHAESIYTTQETWFYDKEISEVQTFKEVAKSLGLPENTPNSEIIKAAEEDGYTYVPFGCIEIADL